MLLCKEFSKEQSTLLFFYGPLVHPYLKSQYRTISIHSNIHWYHRIVQSNSKAFEINLQESFQQQTGVSINFEVDTWANQCKQQSLDLVFYKDLSGNQGRVAGDERQLSDK